MSRVFKSHELAMAAPRRLSLVLPEQDHDSRTINPQELAVADAAEQALVAANAQAEAILQDARHQAERILAEAEAQAKNLRIAGQEAGRQQGYREGRQEAKQQTDAKLREAQSLCEQLRQKDARLLEQSQEEALQLALAVAQRVIGIKLGTDEQAVQAALRQVLKAVHGAREVLLRVSAHDFVHLWEKRQEWRSHLPGLHDLQIEHDPSLRPGDLVLITNQGTIDARVAVAQEEIAAQLLPAGTSDGLEN